MMKGYAGKITFVDLSSGKIYHEPIEERFARKYLVNFANCSVNRKIHLVQDLVKEFNADGVILATNWGCRMMSIGGSIVKEKVYSKLGVQSLILDMDSTDLRSYDDAQTKRKVEVFLKVLGDRKKSN